MSVIRTDEWLMKRNANPLELCEKLVPFFERATPREIFLHLTRHGMYQSSSGLKQVVEEMKAKHIWENVARTYAKLKKQWRGPDVPIFVFPAEWRNKRLSREFNSKGGLAYHDKLFLFLLPHHTEVEIKAVLTHEYNHVCRLAREKKSEEDYTLLDAIILEGLAEAAVGEHVGERYKAKWTTYYSPNQLTRFWQRHLAPYRSIKRDHPKYERLLYGLNFYPKMLGYAVGHYIVGYCLKEKGISFDKLMDLSAEEMAKLAELD